MKLRGRKPEIFNIYKMIIFIWLSLQIQAEQQLIDQDFIGVISSQEGFNYQTIISKPFDLPPHYQIIIKLNFWRIDDWDVDDIFTIYIDNQVAYQYTYLSQDSTTDNCGLTQYDKKYQIEITLDHFSTSTFIIMTSKNGQWWGISEFQLYVMTCTCGCDSCNSLGCFDQILVQQSFNKKSFVAILDSEGWYHNGILIKTIWDGCYFSNQYSPGDHLIKSFTLGSHIAISLYLKVFVINVISPQMYVYIDNILITTTSYTLQVFSYYNNWNCILFQINIQQLGHTQDNLTVKIRVDLSTFSDSFNRFGIRDFQLFKKTSQQFIPKCQITLIDEYSKLDIQPFDSCFDQQYRIFEGSSNCIRGICYNCQNGWEYITAINICVPLFARFKINYQDDFQNGCSFENYNQQESQILFQTQCIYDFKHINQNKIYKERLFDENLINFFQCSYNYLNNEYKIVELQYIIRIKNCNEQIFEKCLICEIGYQLNYNKQKCVPSCHDGIRLFDEVCDDQNNIQFDGCYKCQKSCQLECLMCIESQCLECQEGWELLEWKCHQICGDNRIAKYSNEECDDGNSFSNDGCYNCKFECDQNCFYCYNADLCFRCDDYFEQIDGKCRPICGDGVVIPELEECDDFNQTPYDGCYQCQFQCEINCDICEKGRCIQCHFGYFMDKNQKCLFLEEKYEEQQQDTKNNEINLEDKEDIENIHYSKVSHISNNCGDQILQQYEECDDGNKLNFDGCSDQCIIEDNWQCNSKFPNFCYPQTQIQLLFLNQTYDKQYVRLTFSQKVKWVGTPSNFSQAILTQIYGIKKNQKQIFIIPIIPLELDIYGNPIYEFEIVFSSSYFKIPIFHVSILNGLLDEHNNSLLNVSQKLKIKTPKILKSTQKNVAYKLKTIGNLMTIGLGCSGIIMLIFGDLLLSLEIFDILQYQSCLRFLNVQFPQNIKIYFEFADLVSITPILIKLTIFEKFQNIFGEDYLKSYGKFYEYKINADLITNIYGQITQLLIFFLLYFFLLLFRPLFFKICFAILKKNLHFQVKYKIIQCFVIQIYKLMKKILELTNLYTKQGLSQLFYTNCWDLIFKVIMYLVSNEDSGSRAVVSNCICIIYLGIVFIFLCSHFKRQNQKIVLSKLRMEQHDGLVLCKKLLFLIVLVGMQNHSQFQCILLPFILIFYLGFLIFLRIQSFETLMIIWIEASVTIFTLLSLAFCPNLTYYFNDNQQTIISFVQIGFLILGLLAPILKSGIYFYKQLYKCVKKIRKPNPPRKQLVRYIFEIADS
ncbi:unnamed protein product [Paramecium sonneborni]|uniref:Uncharacterized protein n=1 Tax=Paramecium sonneborni TaxID=65129 RepID=A0A8S1RCW5_9CILI|nr:unnamed protein product [Paramecium sonneborni]